MVRFGWFSRMLVMVVFWGIFAGQALVFAGDTMGDAFQAYEHGDYKKAFRIYKKYAEQGHAGAQDILGDMYWEGRGVKQDDKEAVKWYRLAAEHGNQQAQVSLAWLYREGRGVPQNDEEAVKWYRLTAEQGYQWAQNNLGDMYQEGRGVDQDDKEAVKWYKLAAEQGDSVAQNSLGLMCAEGRGIEQDDKEAVKWFRLAAEQGNQWAQNNLGDMYQEGRGVDQDDKEAVKWYRLAAEQGDSIAQNSLGLMYAQGRGIGQDDKEAVKWYKLAAEQGNQWAQCSLGDMYRDGRGLKQDDQEAVKWYRLAAEQGDSVAQNSLGLMYAEGRGIEQDDKEAVKWYRLAAEQGNQWAQYNLGWMYQDGLGVPQNDEEALKWYKLAAEQGHTEAQPKLDDITKKLNNPSVLAATSLTQNDLPSAKQHINTALTADPDNTDILTLKGLILAAAEDHPAAVTHFQKALALTPNYTPALLALAHSTFNLQQCSETEKIMQQIDSKQFTADIQATEIMTACNACFQPALRTAAWHGQHIDAGGFSNQAEMEEAARLVLRYLKAPRFVTVGVRPRMVGTDEGLLYDPETRRMVYPYPDVEIEPADIIEGRSLDIRGKYTINRNVAGIFLQLYTDFSPAALLINGAAMPTNVLTPVRLHFYPALRQEYHLEFELPQAVTATSLRLDVTSTDGRTEATAITFSDGVIHAENVVRKLLDDL